MAQESKEDKTRRVTNYAFTGYRRNYGDYSFFYQDAVNALVESVNEGRHMRDNIVLPLLFLMQHSLELGLKYNIVYFNEKNKISEKAKIGNHNLEGLFKLFKECFEESIRILGKKCIQVEEKTICDYEKMLKDVEKMLEWIKRSNNTDTAFRYPEDLKGQKAFSQVQCIDLSEVVYHFHKAMDFLNHTTSVFESYFDFLSSMEEEARKLYILEEYDIEN